MTWKEKWQALKESLLGQIHSPYFKNWFEKIDLSYEDTGIICVHCPDEFTRDWVRNHYGDVLQEHLGGMLRFLPHEHHLSSPSYQQPASALKRRYRFKSFDASTTNLYLPASGGNLLLPIRAPFVIRVISIK